MAKRPDRPSGPEEPAEWEDISRSVILQPRLPEDRPSAEEVEWAEIIKELRPGRAEGAQREWIGCGCLGAVGAIGGLITLLLSILMLSGGSAGTFARRLVEGHVFEGPTLSSGEIWATLIAPSLVLIVIGVPLAILGIRQWRSQRRSSA